MKATSKLKEFKTQRENASDEIMGLIESIIIKLKSQIIVWIILSLISLFETFMEPLEGGEDFNEAQIDEEDNLAYLPADHVELL